MFRALHSSRTSQPPLAKTENSFTLTAKIEPQIGALTLELQTKVHEDFTIPEKGPMSLVGTFNQEKALIGIFYVIVKSS